MGVPKFFRYTSERYPCLNELVKQYQIPAFDNMYLDMNGIIHNCSHPDDSNPHFRITEEKIFEEIFHYLSVLFQIIKPKKLFFMAIDGVAPRAKMNQQRGRRFRSAREADQLEKKALQKGEKLPTEKRFDSNCITPGTVFMARLHEQLRYFVKRKISTDPLWASCRIILSGHETPGEGEHKIMDYIRWSRSQPDYDPNTRHCLYGLDADLVMLGMCTHEPHFALLREEVKFGKSTQRVTCVEETNFYLLHLSLLRQYLEQEFIEIKDNLPFQYDLEKIVDDWVLMGFLVGNDFIPNLPNMHIHGDALPLLYKTYMKVLPQMDGYINEAGDLNLARFEMFMEELSKIDREAFQDTYADLKYFEAKTGSRPNHTTRKSYKPNDDETFDVDVEEIKKSKNSDLQALISATESMFVGEKNDSDFEYTDCDDEEAATETSDEEALVEMEFELHKKDYYMNKLDYANVTDEVLRSQAECFVRAIQWNLYYYYKGCPSWCWFYPHHYAPYISDIKGFKDLKIEFELGTPFKPFEQLLGVLPAASKELLPEPFHELMTEENSPIVHYYPINFDTDLNGKKNEWEAVVLIPFIDEVHLLKSMEPYYQQLTEEEKRRNTHGPMLIYDRSPQSLGRVEAPEYFPPIVDCLAIEKKIMREELEVPPEKLKSGMLPNAMRHLVFPGFPTMKHLEYTTFLEKKKVKVFDQPSRNENMIIKLKRDLEKLEELNKYEHLLGTVIWVGWPHITKAKVIAISNEDLRLHHEELKDGVKSVRREQNVGNLHKQWLMERSTIVEHNMNRLGIELGPIDVIIHAVNLRGYKYVVTDRSKMALEQEWCTVPCGYASHTILTDISAHVVSELTQFATPEELFKPDEIVFLLTEQYYGNMGKVVSSSDTARTGRVHITMNEEPALISQPALRQNLYKTTHHAAAAAGISNQMLSRLTGCIFIVLGRKTAASTEQMPKVNIGLNLKFNKKNLEVAGYTRRCPVSNTWLYSQRCVDLVLAYLKKFPKLFDCLSNNFGNDVFFESDLWPDNVGEGKPAEITDWLKEQPHVNALKRPCCSEALEPEELLEVRREQMRQFEEYKKHDKKSLSLKVKISLLYKPDMHHGDLLPDPSADFQMYDRVVCCSNTISVPIGSKGIITAIYHQNEVNTVRLSDKLNKEVMYQVMFDEPFPGGMKEELIESACFYRMLPCNMLNISYGRKLRNQKENTAAFAPSQQFNNRDTKPQTLDVRLSSREQQENKKEQGSEAFTNFINQSMNTSRKPNSYSQQRSQLHQGMTTQVQNIFAAAASPKPSTTPTLLRREDGHYSAFASYSPTKDKQPQQPEPSNSKENGSEFLKTLLKISNSDDSDVKPQKNTSAQNWREQCKINSIENSKLSQPPANWRTDRPLQEPFTRTTLGPNVRPSVFGPTTNTNVNNQKSILGSPPAHLQPRHAPPAPLLPTPQLSGQIMQQALLGQSPQLKQNPGQNFFPSFGFNQQSSRIPPANQNMHQHAQMPRPVNTKPEFMTQNQDPSMLPMPRFGTSATTCKADLNSNQNDPVPQERSSKSSIETANPFVPLQAIANRRKNQHTNQTQPKKMISNTPQVAPVTTSKPQQSNSAVQVPKEQQNTTSEKPKKKQRSRIGANIPVLKDENY